MGDEKEGREEELRGARARMEVEGGVKFLEQG